MTSISLLVATRNRALILHEFLGALSIQAKEIADWEIVLIDNGSTDNTPNVITAFQPLLPMIRLHEPQQGKNNALNRGLAHASGELILFGDDDAVPSPRWLRLYEQCSEDKKAFDIFGGPVVGRWPAPPPDWVLANTHISHTCFGTTDSMLLEGEVDPLLLSGANFAVRRSSLPSRNAFDSGIGPKGQIYAMGSEADLLRRLASQGRKAWFITSALVEHIVRPDQLTERWLMNRAKNSGRGVEKMWPTEGRNRIFGVPAGLFRRATEQWMKLQSIRLRGSRDDALTQEWMLNRTLGSIAQASAERRSA